MTWLGQWKHQYGSVREISDESDHRIVGRFRTALEDSGFFGQELPIVGVHGGDRIGLAGAGASTGGDMVVTYTGLLRAGRIETLRYVVADAAPDGPGTTKKLDSRRSTTTNADTFERVS